MDSCNTFYLVGSPRTGTVYVLFLWVLPSPECCVASLGDGMSTVDVLCQREIVFRKLFPGVC